MNVCKGLSAYVDPIIVTVGIASEYRTKIGKEPPLIDLKKPLKQWVLDSSVPKWEGLRTFQVLARDFDGKPAIDASGNPFLRFRSVSYVEAISVNIPSGETNTYPVQYSAINTDPIPYLLPAGNFKLFLKATLPQAFSMQALFSGSDEIFVVDMDAWKETADATPSNENIIKLLTVIDKKLDILLSK